MIVPPVLTFLVALAGVGGDPVAAASPAVAGLLSGYPPPQELQERGGPLPLPGTPGALGGSPPFQGFDFPGGGDDFSRVTLVPEVSSVRPGEPFMVGLLVEMEENWHTYWKNAGDSGSEAVLEWSLPPGSRAGPIQWPVPERIPTPPLMTYGYEDRVLLLVELTPPDHLAPGGVFRGEAQVDWLVCHEICLFATDRVSLYLPVSVDSPAAAPEWVEEFQQARDRLPVAPPEGWRLRAFQGDGELYLRVDAPHGVLPEPPEFYFFPHDPLLLDHAAHQSLRWAGDRGVLTLPRAAYRSGVVAGLEGVLAWSVPAGEVGAALPPGLSIAVTVGDGGVTAALRAPPSLPPLPAFQGGGGGLSLLSALLLAFLGGILLNLMPCVFPVLSLKAMGLVERGGGEGRKARLHGLAFGFGVVGSFLLLAGILLALRAGGSEVGWGFQLQSPRLVALLAALLFLVGLNFLGVFQVGTRLTRLGGVDTGGGYRGSFFTGVLAAVVATPCTAPFMGAAVGAALVRPPVEALAIFAGLGGGMALPYMLVASWPGLLSRLPPPGRWMESLRQAMAFPMFAVALWLLWVFALQVGSDGALALMLSLLSLGLAVWILGRWPRQQIRFRARLLSRSGALAAGVVAALLAVQGVRSDPPPVAGAGERSEGSRLVWEEFSPERVAELQAQGRPYFVDFTAAWCISCQVNRRVVLTAAPVEAAFRESGVARLRADWTRRDPIIARALADYGRNGIPLYVLHPGGEGEEPLLLPTILTQQVVFEALERHKWLTAWH